jgi:hypothetical protein
VPPPQYGSPGTLCLTSKLAIKYVYGLPKAGTCCFGVRSCPTPSIFRYGSNDGKEKAFNPGFRIMVAKECQQILLRGRDKQWMDPPRTWCQEKNHCESSSSSEAAPEMTWRILFSMLLRSDLAFWVSGGVKGQLMSWQMMQSCCAPGWEVARKL